MKINFSYYGEHTLLTPAQIEAIKKQVAAAPRNENDHPTEELCETPYGADFIRYEHRIGTGNDRQSAHYVIITGKAGLIEAVMRQPKSDGKTPFVFCGTCLSTDNATLEALQPYYSFTFTPLARFTEAEMSAEDKAVAYVDTPRSGRRNRKSCYLVVAKNYVTIFQGQSIDGLAVATLESSHKNGKWSTATYRLDLAAGVKVVSIEQDWGTGEFCNNITSVKAMQKDLKLDGCTPAAVAEFIKSELPSTWERHAAFITEMAAIEDAGVSETFEYHFVAEISVNRQGWKWLILNGEVWNPSQNPAEGEQCSCKFVVKYRNDGGTHSRNNRSEYTLELPVGTEVEEIFEGGWEGEETLATRGYTQKERWGYWFAPATSESGNTPFAGLFKK